MKLFYKILIFLIIYALLAIPDNRNSINKPEKNSLTISSKWWGKFAQNLVKFRITNEQNQQYYYNKHRELLTHHLDELLLQLTEPDDPILDSINYHINKLSALASLVPNTINEFQLDVSRWRKLLKYQSRYWDTSSETTNKKLFKLLIESKLAFESALIQSGTQSTHLSTSKSNSNFQTVTVGNLQFKSGDIIAFNLNNQNDPYVSYIRELPNVYKHLGTVYIKDADASIIYIDREKGTNIVSLSNFIGKLAPNGTVLRLREDIPSILKSPEIPSLAASAIHQLAIEGRYKYDYNFDSDTPDYLFDWELINRGYKAYNLNLEPDQFIRNSNSIHLGSLKSHLKAFEIEFDHRFEIAGEWYNSQQLYDNRLLTSATSSIVESNNKTDFINPMLLPLYRLTKAYSMIIGQLGLKEPIPSGVTAQTQLVYDALANKQKALVQQLTIELTKYEKDQNHKATYLKMLQKADEIKAGQLAGLR